MTLQDLAQVFLDKRQPAGLFIDLGQATACAIEATRHYLAWQFIRSNLAAEEADITPTTVVDADEWGIISPLFDLYCERETALMIEASRGLGVEATGRSVSEVMNDITQALETLKRDAFYEPVVSVGFPE